jgi:hypothetical protein
VEGWQPVEDIVRWGFGQAPVVMANEAHNGLARSVRTRVIGARMIRAAHEAGVRRLAMEALGWPERDVPGPITALPDDPWGGYLSQPEMRTMIGTALDMGWTLWAYEDQVEITPETDRAWLRSLEYTNIRERKQAVNLGRLIDAAPGEPMLVWCGNGHATKCGTSSPAADEWVPMGWHFRELSGLDPFVIDQTVTVEFSGRPEEWRAQLVESLADTLADLGGTAGILRVQAPPPLDDYIGVDAFIVSTDNELTGEEPTEDELAGPLTPEDGA